MDQPVLPKNVRLKSLLVADCLLRLFELTAELGKGDLESAVVYLAVASAGAQAVMRDSELRARYGGAEPMPEELRRPISRRAIAESVGLPRETVRRKIAALVARGRLVEDGGGVVAQGPVIEQEGNLQFVLEVLKELERTGVALKRSDEG